MGWFQRAVDKGVRQGVESAVEDFAKPGGRLEEIIDQQLWLFLDAEISRSAPLTRLGFVWAMRLYFHKRGCSRAEASDLANSTLAEFLADEKIKFGHPDYAWTREGAEAVADEYQIQHWEAA